MLELIFITDVTLVIILIVKESLLPMWRFMIRADAVINLYSLYKELLKIDFSKENKIKLTYVIKGIHKYKFELSNTNEASIEFEKIVQEALEYYDKHIIVGNSFKVRQKELLQICSEVRMMRWQKQ